MAGKGPSRKRKHSTETDDHLPPSKLSANSLLLKAVCKGRQAEVASLFESSFEQISTRTLTQAVFQASENGHKRLLQYMVRHGVNINNRNSKGYTALLIAAERGYMDVVKFLIKNGADVNSKSKSGKTALILAAEKACFLPIIEFLTADCRTDVNIQDMKGRTALMVSVQMCDMAAMRVLMFHKEVDFGLQDRRGRTAFDFAKHYGVLEEFTTLQKCITNSNLNPIILAVRKSNIRLLREFIDGDYYNLEHADHKGYTPLLLALKIVPRDSVIDILETLIISGANVNSLYAGDPECTPLICAAELRNMDAVKLLVEYGADVNAQTPVLKLSALMMAAQSGFPEIMDSLLEYGADFNLRDACGDTALTYALNNSQISCADALIHHGADIFGEDLIRAACMDIDTMQYLQFPSLTSKIANSMVCFMLIQRGLRSKNYAIVEFLLDHTEDIKRHLKHLFFMAVTRDMKMTHLLLDRGASVNSVNPFGISALMKAACIDNREMVELLIKGGAHMNFQSRGKTVLVLTIGKQAMNALGALLEAGVDVNYVPKHPLSWVPLHRAILLGFNAITERLISHGADLNAVDREGQTPLLFAIKWQNYHVMRLLIAKGANLDSQMITGIIPLHNALVNQDIQTAELLLNAGSDVNAADSNGKTALMICSQVCTTNVMLLLLKYGADVNASDETGSSALHYAVKHSIFLTDKAELLLKNGAAINRKDHQGQTAFMIASRYCKNNMLQFLLEHGADVNAKDKLGLSALTDALFTDNERVKYLICCGADVNIQNNLGYTALMIAADLSNDLAMNALLKASADVHILDNNYCDVLSLALAKYNKCNLCFGGDFACRHFSCIEMLINAGAEHDMSNQCTLALYKAIICNKTKLVQLLVSSGIPPLELPRDCEDLLNYSVPHKFFMSICGVPCHQPVLHEFVSALNGSIYAKSPLSTAIFCRNATICEFFIKNWYFNSYDMSRLSLDFLSLHIANAEGTRLVTVCEELFSKPFSLAIQSFVTVGKSFNSGRDRKKCIRALPIPQVMQEKLLYGNAKNDCIEATSQEVVSFMLPYH